MLSSCAVDDDECRAAARAQAEAEAAWSSTIEAQAAAHDHGEDHHPGVEAQLLDDRIEMIIATAAVQRAC